VVTDTTASECPFKVLQYLPVSTAQIIVALSRLELAKWRSFGAKHT